MMTASGDEQRLRVSIVVIGDEILGGFVADTNSGWLAGRLQALGVPLERVITVPDDPEAIDEALQTELARARPRVILTSGGIGSTPDDVTFDAVARSLGRSLVTEPTIDARITHALDWTAAQGMRVTSEHDTSMRRMAQIPSDAYLLTDDEGIAPGVAVDVDGGSGQQGGATIVILPGIPSELRRITAKGIEPLLLAGRGVPQHVAEIVHGYPESTLNPVLGRLTAEHPGLHIGSYPGRECIVRLKGPRDEVEAAMNEVRDYLAELERDPASARVQQRWRSTFSAAPD